MNNLIRLYLLRVANLRLLGSFEKGTSDARDLSTLQSSETGASVSARQCGVICFGVSKRRAIINVWHPSLSAIFASSPTLTTASPLWLIGSSNSLARSKLAKALHALHVHGTAALRMPEFAGVLGRRRKARETRTGGEKRDERTGRCDALLRTHLKNRFIPSAAQRTVKLH